jgi:hypothetical protein
VRVRLPLPAPVNLNFKRSAWIEGETSIRPTTARRYRGLIDHQLIPLLLVDG